MSSAKSSLSGMGSIWSYTTGFVLSLVLTLGAYFLVTHHTYIGGTLLAAIVFLALVQLGVQLYFFLHLGAEPKPYWKSLVFIFMAVVVVILVGGSLWIMANLNYRTMSPSDINSYIIHDEGFKK